MTPILCALLSLGLCLGQRMTQAPDRLPRPSLREENGSLVPEGRNVTLSCRGSWEADLYRLEKKQGSKWLRIMDETAAESKGKFFLSSVTWSHAGTYYCRYRHSSLWSESSDALKLVVTDLYDQPSLAALPSPEVASGQNVTLQCWSELWYDWFALYKDGEEISRSKIQPHQSGSQAKFLFPTVTSVHGGTYQCYTFLSDNPYVWSSPSTPLVLQVSDAAVQDYTVGNLVRLILAGLILILLGVLMIENWHSLNSHKNQSKKPCLSNLDQDRPQERSK